MCTSVQAASAGTPESVAAELQQVQEAHDAIAALNKRQVTVYAVRPDAGRIQKQRRRLQASNADIGVCGQLCQVGGQKRAQLVHVQPAFARYSRPMTHSSVSNAAAVWIPAGASLYLAFTFAMLCFGAVALCNMHQSSHVLRCLHPCRPKSSGWRACLQHSFWQSQHSQVRCGSNLFVVILWSSQAACMTG